MLISITFVSSTQIMAQIQSQECIGHIKQHFMTTSLVTCHHGEMLYQKLDAP